MVNQQYRAWSDCIDGQAGLALYWWQRLIACGSRRKRVKELAVQLQNDKLMKAVMVFL